MHSLVAKIGKIVRLSEQEQAFVQSLFSKRALDKGEFFLKEGQVCRHLGFVEQGLLRYYMIKDGEEITYSFAVEYDFISNYESFLPEQPSDKYIQALENCVVWQIEKTSLQRLYSEVREGDRFGRIAIEQVFVQLLNRLSSVYRDDPETRYLRFMEEHREIQQRVPQYIIASYVGVKPQSLSRIRKRMSQ